MNHDSQDECLKVPLERLYSKLPLWYHLIGLPEIMLQTLSFSFLLLAWERQSLNPAGSFVQAHPTFSEWVKAAMASCFGWIGYAIGGLLSVVLVQATTGAMVDTQAAATNLTMQFMFVVAFAVNIICAFVIARGWQAEKIRVWQMFGMLWLVDSLVPLVYQSVVMSPPPLHMALLLGFFPALIITSTIFFSHNRPIQTSRHAL